MAGAAGGAALGSMIPGVGTAAGALVGGILGSLAGGTAASMGSKRVLDRIVEDDARKMPRRLEQCLGILCADYLLSRAELERLQEQVKRRITPAFLRSMYAGTDRGAFVSEQLEPLFQATAVQRAPVKAPPDEDVRERLGRFEKAVMQEAQAAASPGSRHGPMRLCPMT